MKMWKDMTPEEKGALLLAHHEVKDIEYFSYVAGAWCSAKGKPTWAFDGAYRVKPVPVIKTVVMHGCKGNEYWSFDSFPGPEKGDTHKITFNEIDGVVDVSSVKMEKL